MRPPLTHRHAAQGNRVTSRSNYFLKIFHLPEDYPNASLWEQPVWAPSRCSKSACPSEGGRAQGHLEKSPALEKLCLLSGECGLVFTKEDLTGISGMRLADRVSAAACAEQPWKPRLREDKWQTQGPRGRGRRPLHSSSGFFLLVSHDASRKHV